MFPGAASGETQSLFYTQICVYFLMTVFGSVTLLNTTAVCVCVCVCVCVGLSFFTGMTSFGLLNG